MPLNHLSVPMMVLGLAALAASEPPGTCGVPAATPLASPQENSTMQTHRYVGMWVTADGHVRHELLPNGRYDEARGRKQSAYQGEYRITGNHIDYVDDTGFTADGKFVDGVLYHAGMVLYRED